MISKASETKDLLIQEVRQRRQDLLAKYDFDLKKYCEALQKRQSEHPEKIVDRRKQSGK
ncbi:MAG: hypothetical protein AABZ47_09015 [Planctomycetota bacterium]